MEIVLGFAVIVVHSSTFPTPRKWSRGPHFHDEHDEDGDHGLFD